ncbi:hypothetical protein GCM10009634_00500 [Saccharothrix xinjiangensis]
MSLTVTNSSSCSRPTDGLAVPGRTNPERKNTARVGAVLKGQSNTTRTFQYGVLFPEPAGKRADHPLGRYLVDRYSGT